MNRIGSTEFFDDYRLYDIVSGHLVDDIQFYLKLIEKYGQPVLELMCGSGRLTIPFAKQGVDIAGLDLSRPMLDGAREKAKTAGLDIEFIEGDCRDFYLDRKYNFIFIPFNSIQLILDRRDIEACFTSIKANMEREGRFVFEVFNPSLDILNRDPEKKFRIRDFDEPESGDKIEVSEKTAYDKATQVLTSRWFFKSIRSGEEKEKILKVRILFPQEIDTMLGYFGFEIENKFGDYDFSLFTAESPRQIFVCHRR